MRGFWNRDNDADEDQNGEEYAEGDEEQDAEGDEDAEDAEEQEPEDAALQARIQEEAQKLAAAEVTKIRLAAQKRGLDWTGQDFGVTDHQRAAQAFGFGQQQEREQPAARVEADDPEPEVDEYDQATLKAHTAWQIRQATKQMATENQRLQRMVIESELSRAMDRVPDAIKRHAPHLEEILDHPEFVEQFRAAIGTQAPELWADSRNLARVAAMLSVDLDREQIPKKETPEPSRDESGRFSRGAQQRQQIGQMLPTRGTGAPPEDDLSDGERRFIRMGRLDSAEEARALRPQGAEGIATFEAYERFLARKQARNRK